MVKINDILTDAEITELERNRISKDEMSPQYLRSRDKLKDTGIVIDNLHILYQKFRFDNGLAIGVWDEDKLAAELILYPVTYQNVRAYSVGRATVTSTYQGQGIGWALYHGLITLLGINLLSDGSHSDGARKLWLRLAKDPGIKAYGFDKKTSQLFRVKPDSKKSELISVNRQVQLYDNYDSGLILVKSGGPDDKKLASLLKRTTTKKPKDPFGVTQFPALGYDDNDY